MDIAPLTLDDLTPWAELLAVSFDRSTEDMVRLLRWLHSGYDLIAYGAWDGDRLAAQYAVLWVNLCCDSASVCAGMSLNMSVHPDYRGRGLVKQVSAPVYAEVEARGGVCGFGFSNAEGVQVDRKSKGYGYRVVGKLRSTVGLVLPRRDVSALEITDMLPDSLCAMNAEITHGQGDHIQFATTWAKIHHRYAQHPFRRYRYGLWREDDQLRGVVVYRPTCFGTIKGASVLGAYCTEAASLVELMARWSAAVTHEGVRFVHLLTTPNAALLSAVRGLTLPYSRSPYYLTVKPIGAEPHNSTPTAFFDFSRWAVMGGDIL